MNVDIVTVLKERAEELVAQGLEDSVNYQELIKQIELLEAVTPSTESYVYPGGDCQV